MMVSIQEEKIWIQTRAERRQVETQGEDSHLQAKERGLEQILPSQPSEGANPANTLILNF